MLRLGHPRNKCSQHGTSGRNYAEVRCQFERANCSYYDAPPFEIREKRPYGLLLADFLRGNGQEERSGSASTEGEFVRHVQHPVPRFPAQREEHSDSSKRKWGQEMRNKPVSTPTQTAKPRNSILYTLAKCHLRLRLNHTASPACMETRQRHEPGLTVRPIPHKSRETMSGP